DPRSHDYASWTEEQKKEWESAMEEVIWGVFEKEHTGLFSKKNEISLEDNDKLGDGLIKLLKQEMERDRQESIPKFLAWLDETVEYWENAEDGEVLPSPLKDSALGNLIDDRPELIRPTLRRVRALSRSYARWR